MTNELKLSNPSALSQLHMRLRSSLENIVDGDDDGEEEPMVTFPDETPTNELELELHAPQLPCVTTTASGDLAITNDHLTTAETVKFEEKRTVSASKTKVIKDGFSSEQVSTHPRHTTHTSLRYQIFTLIQQQQRPHQQ